MRALQDMFEKCYLSQVNEFPLKGCYFVGLPTVDTITNVDFKNLKNDYLQFYLTEKWYMSYCYVCVPSSKDNPVIYLKFIFQNMLKVIRQRL